MYDFKLCSGMVAFWQRRLEEATRKLKAWKLRQQEVELKKK
jgi:hypothetical protein